MNKNIFKQLLPLALLLILPASARAQGSDFGLDFSLEAQKKLSKQWSISMAGKLRRRDDAKTNDQWTLALGADYKPLKWMKLSAGYSFLYDNNDRITYFDSNDKEVQKGTAQIGDPKKRAQYWGTRHRFNLSVTLSRKLVGDFRFSLRERWQYTYRPEHTVDQRWDYADQEFDGKQKTIAGKGKNVLRSRFQVSYDRKKLPVSPYVSVELYNARKLEKVRYQAGVDYALSRQHSIGAFYRYQTVSEDEDFDLETDTHLIGVAYQFKF